MKVKGLDWNGANDFLIKAAIARSKGSPKNSTLLMNCFTTITSKPKVLTSKFAKRFRSEFIEAKPCWQEVSLLQSEMSRE